MTKSGKKTGVLPQPDQHRAAPAHFLPTNNRERCLLEPLQGPFHSLIQLKIILAEKMTPLQSDLKNKIKQTTRKHSEPVRNHLQTLI